VSGRPRQRRPRGDGVAARELLEALGQDLALAPTWRAQAARATAAVERSDLLQLIARQLLVASRGGRARLRRWLEARGGIAPTPVPPWLLREWLTERVALVGDSAALPLVVEALCLVPEPVRHAVVTETCFTAVGWSSRAWASSSVLVDREGNRKPRLVMLGPASDVGTVLHEVGHGWHSPLCEEPVPLGSTRGVEQLLALAARDGWRARADAMVARGERLADGCMFAWLARPTRGEARHPASDSPLDRYAAPRRDPPLAMSPSSPRPKSVQNPHVRFVEGAPGHWSGASGWRARPGFRLW
jgi:hypothetical protein